MTVSSRITGLIGSSSNPISGMTIATLILTCTIFVALGWTGDYYSPVAICVGAIVCIASANAGATSQDLKTGYIVGATPMYQQIGLIIGVLTSALVIGMTTLYLHNVMAIGSTSLPAPQATLMATIIKGLLEPEPAVGPGAGRRLHHRDARAVRHPLALVRGRLVPADCDDRADFRRRPGPRLRREAHGPGRGIRSRRRHAVQLGLIAGGSLAGILYAVLFGRKLIEDAEGVTGLIPAIHEGTLGMIAGGLLFLALAVVLARAAQKKVM